MSERDASRVQLDFPQLTADLIAALRLTGTVGLLDFSDLVRPVFLIGSRGVDFGGVAPTFASAQVFQGSVNDPAANTIIADTGPLPGGDYDLFASISVMAATGVASTYTLQHRNAANAATLATLLTIHFDGGVVRVVVRDLPLLGYTIGLNERIRATNSALLAGTATAEILAALRPTP